MLTANISISGKEMHKKGTFALNLCLKLRGIDDFNYMKKNELGSLAQISTLSLACCVLNLHLPQLWHISRDTYITGMSSKIQQYPIMSTEPSKPHVRLYFLILSRCLRKAGRPVGLTSHNCAARFSFSD